MKLLAIDPALRNCGIVTALLEPDTMKYKVLSMQLSQAAPTKNKQIRKNSDDLGRCRVHVEQLRPRVDWADIVLCEIPQGSQSARAMASYGACIGLLAWIDKPLIQISPTEVKVAVTGNKIASKEDIIKWATTTQPHAQWLRRNGKVTANNEHLADAVGVIEAATKEDDFKMMCAAYSMARNHLRPRL